MMVLEVGGGLAFGSIALVADGLHMSTHAGALLLAALAYRYARKYARDPRFSFGTGKLGDLAGFTSAIVLAMIALLIGYEAIGRLFAPVPIRFAEAIPIAGLGLAVNVASAWLLSGSGHHHGHSHAHNAGHNHGGHDTGQTITTPDGVLSISVFEDGAPPVFRLRPQVARAQIAGVPLARDIDIGVTIETVRPNGARQVFAMRDCGTWLESADPIPEPHQFIAHVRLGNSDYPIAFEEHSHGHGAAHRDNNMRAAIVHVLADAAVSVLVIIGLLLARTFGWLWMDPIAGMIGACVIAAWSYGLVRDTGAILLDMVPDPRVADGIRRAIEAEGDALADLHLWRLGPGHLGAIVAVITGQGTREPDYYRRLLARFPALSHITVEVQPPRC